MSTTRTPSPTSSRRMRLTAVVTGLAGAVWGALSALGALDVIIRGPLHPVDGRAGQIVGLAALGLAAVALAGALLAAGRPAIGSTLLFLASFGGFLCVGGAWTGPGVVQLVASALCLAAVDNPFAAEIAREHGERERTHGRPG